MAHISEQIIEQIRSTADIFDIVSEYVQLKKRGHNFFGLCPFHDEKTPSFSVNQQRQIYKCFGCGAGGGTINFIMDVENLEFVDAIKFLADRYNIELDINNTSQTKDLRSKIINLHENATQIFIENLNKEEGKQVLLHLQDRGLTIETIKKFKLGYSINKSDYLINKIRSKGEEADVMLQSGLFINTESGYIDRFRGRIMFSIFDSTGNISAFAGRVFQSQSNAKYVNSPETSIYNKSRILYGLHESKQEIREKNEVIVVEGYLDFLQLYQAGIKNCVAVSGTAFTEQHALQLKRFCNTIYLAYDADSAGKTAAIKAGYLLLKSGVSPKIINIPNGFDPDDWVKNEGKQPFLNAMSNSEKLILFHYNNFSDQSMDSNKKSEFVNSVLIELSEISDPITREIYAKELSEFVDISSTSIMDALQGFLNRSNKKNKLKESISVSINNNLLEEDLIRLCFSEESKVRKFLFDHIQIEWISSDIICKIYEKLYIHLHSESSPRPSLIMDTLKKSEFRNKLAEIIFNINNFNSSISAAIDCVIRLHTKCLNTKINNKRNELKNIISNNDSIVIMKQIEELQHKKNSLKHLYSINE